jgi:tRNA(fMet)-specific endonuclease VapC
LLDTDTCIEAIKGQHPQLTAKLASAPPSSIVISTIVRAELMTGATKSTRSGAIHDALAFFRLYTSVVFDELAADTYAIIRVALERAGMSIGPNDLLIAATALANGFTLVTHNTREFGRVAGLVLEDWLI